MRIIDFHTHAFPENIAEKAVDFLSNYYKCEVPTKGRVCDLLKSASEIGVEKLVTFSTATKVSQVENINNFIASLVNKQNIENVQNEQNIQIIGFGTLHQDYENIEDELIRIKRLGLRGIKLHPDFQGFSIDDEKLFQIYERLGDFPLLIHVGDESKDKSSPVRLASVLEKFPKLRVIAAHLGGYQQWDEVLDYLIGKDLYFDTSSALAFMSKEQAINIIRLHGVEKILFATDFPMASHKDELERFLNLGLTDVENELILYTNAQKLLGL